MEQISLADCSQIMMIMMRRRQDTVSFCGVISKVTLIVSVLVVAGCDAVQDPPSAPVAQKLVVFNPSISMSEFKPGQFIRVTGARQLVSITRGFWMGTHEVTQRDRKSGV